MKNFIIKLLLFIILCLVSYLAFCQQTTTNRTQKEINLRLGLGISGVMAVYGMAEPAFHYAGFVETDKLMHFGTGATISGLGTSLAYRITKRNNWAMGFGFVCGIGAGLVKEYIIDKKLCRKPVSSSDLAATCIGAAAGAFTVSAVISLNTEQKPKKRLFN